MPVPLSEIMAEFAPDSRARIEAKAAELIKERRTLTEIRKALGVTQADLAKALKTSQPNVVRIEKSADVLVSTVARVVEALGGKLLMQVELPDGREVTLRIGQSKGRRTVKPQKRAPIPAEKALGRRARTTA